MDVDQLQGMKSKRTDEIVHQATRNGFRTQAEEDNANDEAILQAYIELLADEEREQQHGRGSSAGGSSPRELSASGSPRTRSNDSTNLIDLTDSTRDFDGNMAERGDQSIPDATPLVTRDFGDIKLAQ